MKPHLQLMRFKTIKNLSKDRPKSNLLKLSHKPLFYFEFL